jgi:monoamine oxidase
MNLRSLLGVSGLINAIELSTAGHRVTVYEASDRLGGRILTHRIPDKGYITELGAMRLPLKQHPLTNTYVTERYKLKVTPFVGYDTDTLFYINGHRRTFNERILPEDTGFKVHESERNKVRLLYMLFFSSLLIRFIWTTTAKNIDFNVIFRTMITVVVHDRKWS